MHLKIIRILLFGGCVLYKCQFGLYSSLGVCCASTHPKTCFRGVCGQNRFLGSMPKPSDPAETWAKVLVLVWQSAQSCFCLLGGNSCRGGAGSQLGPPRGGLRVSVGIRWPESRCPGLEPCARRLLARRLFRKLLEPATARPV